MARWSILIVEQFASTFIAVPLKIKCPYKFPFIFKKTFVVIFRAETVYLPFTVDGKYMCHPFIDNRLDSGVPVTHTTLMLTSKNSFPFSDIKSKTTEHSLIFFLLLPAMSLVLHFLRNNDVHD